jgi:hypothetical protein
LRERVLIRNTAKIDFSPHTSETTGRDGKLIISHLASKRGSIMDFEAEFASTTHYVFDSNDLDHELEIVDLKSDQKTRGSGDTVAEERRYFDTAEIVVDALVHCVDRTSGRASVHVPDIMRVHFTQVKAEAGRKKSEEWRVFRMIG